MIICLYVTQLNDVLKSITVKLPDSPSIQDHTTNKVATSCIVIAPRLSETSTGVAQHFNHIKCRKTQVCSV